jgi:hypothetical protein
MLIETKTETTAPLVETGAAAFTGSCLVSVAEDAGFEPARA